MEHVRLGERNPIEDKWTSQNSLRSEQDKSKAPKYQRILDSHNNTDTEPGQTGWGGITCPNFFSTVDGGNDERNFENHIKMFAREL
ncbi:hypothetical protein [Saccharicrinis carchari]|uniref:hypothetical protein n=1 Tax=Saccharicrinis carchari TaxID=1168039 RepID=UPI001C8F9183|nr:hypothetical protein [Saccharicrinis carchari]